MTSNPAYRWWVLWLLFFATTINYLDRIVFSVLVPVIRKDLNLDDHSYGLVTSAFTGAYTIGFIFVGKFIDRYGTKAGYAVATLWWSIAAGLHAVARTPLDLGLWRGALGLGESGNFPAAVKAVAEWFPAEQRALANGLFNSGTTIASVIGPPVFVWMSNLYGWRSTFVFTASLGVIWLVLWQFTYKPNAAPAADIKERNIPWIEAFRTRQTWGFALGKFFTDPVWWFYLFWLPLYLYDVRKFNMQQVGWVLPVLYGGAAIGSVGGGWLSGFFMRRGWPAGKARKAALGICAAFMPFAALGAVAPSNLHTVVLFSVALGGHQGWSANLFATPSDVFPRNAVASVIGIGGALGGVGGVIFSSLIPGYVIPLIGYKPVFLIMGCFYLVGWYCVHTFMGGLEPIGSNPATTSAGTPSK